MRQKKNQRRNTPKSIYHTLFESHLTYGITVWGGIPKSKLQSLFVLQKQCIRILFGDKLSYLDKFCTCARTRPYPYQLLGTDFYTKEHTKPLFGKHNIMTLHNLYNYHISLTMFKLLENKSPNSLYSCFKLSKRKETLILTSEFSNDFVYNACSTWNIIRDSLAIYKFNCMKIGTMKNKLKNFIFSRQNIGDPNEWSDENFQLR